MDLLGNGNSGSSANMANRGGRGGFGRGHGGNNRGRGQGGRGHSNNNNTSRAQGAGCGNAGRGGAGSSNNNSKIQCQVCFMFGPSADRCWHRFEEDYVPEERHASVAMNSYSTDNVWYTYTGATDHITGELEKLSLRDKYNGTYQVHTANGAGMGIRHIGHSTIRTPTHNLQLRNILHVSSANKNLVFIHRLATDNNVLNFILISYKGS
jgi:hypothetical protein